MWFHSILCSYYSSEISLPLKTQIPKLFETQLEELGFILNVLVNHALFGYCFFLMYVGGFQQLDLIIKELKSHMTC